MPSKARAHLRTSWLLTVRRYWALAMGLSLTLLVLTQGTPFLDRAELAAYDARFHLRVGNAATPNHIVIVDVYRPESATILSETQDWVPRARIAQVIDILHHAGARVIGLGFYYDHASSYGRADDAALARAIKRAGNVVLPTSIVLDRGRPLVLTPVPPLAKYAAGMGVETGQVDSDGVTRLAPLLQVGPGGRLYPSWQLVVASVALHQPVSRVLRGLPTNILVNYIGQLSFFGLHNPWNEISLDNLLEILRNFPLANGNLPLARIRLTNSIVLILPAPYPGDSQGTVKTPLATCITHTSMPTS